MASVREMRRLCVTGMCIVVVLGGCASLEREETEAVGGGEAVSPVDHRVASADENMRVLEQQADELASQIRQHKQEIRRLAEPYGTTDLTRILDTEMERFRIMRAELTRVELARIKLESELMVLKGLPAEQATAEEMERIELELRKTVAYEQNLRRAADSEDERLKHLGRLNWDLQDRQLAMQLDEETFDQVSRRIRQLRAERAGQTSESN